MRRAALTVACVVVGTGVAVVLAASGSAVAPPLDGGTPMQLTSTDEGRVELRADPHGMWDYYGQITSPEPNQSGSYRALCAALEPSTTPPARKPAFTGQARASDAAGDRLMCTVVVLFGGETATTGGSLVIEGVVTRPAGSELFAAPSGRQLAVTGGTGGIYQGSQGKAQATGSHHISVVYW